jgi:serine/threonine protein kinase
MRADQNHPQQSRSFVKVTSTERFVLIEAIALLFRQTFVNELETLARLDHRNVSCLCAVQLDSLYLVQEHSHFGTLQDYFHTLSNHPSHDSTFQKSARNCCLDRSSFC